jgi:hypothetical protein
MPRSVLPSESEALAISEILVRFAAEQTKDLSKTTVSTICTALDAQQDNTWDQQIATDFWCAFNSLCTLIKPVTVDSLSTSLRELPPPKWKFWVRNPKPLSLPRRTAAHYLYLLMFLLLVSVVLGYLVSTATSMSTQIKELIHDCDDLTDKMVSETDLLEREIGEQGFNALITNTENQQKHPQSIENIALLQKQLTQQKYLLDQMLAKDLMMSKITLFGLKWKAIQGDLSPAENIADLRTAISNYYGNRTAATKDLLDASVISGVISSTVLPIVLGLMGACAYVVRLISDQIKDATFSQTSPTRHVVRVALGGLTGVVIGFSGVASAVGLSSSALAFIAGYAVEPVFATFDSIAAKFRQ